MIKYVSARFVAGLLCAAAAAVILPATAIAFENEPVIVDEDTSEKEISPPNSGEEERSDRDRRDEASDERESKEPEAPRSVAKPERGSSVSTAAAREAAKRALFSDPDKDKNKPNPLLDKRGPDYYDLRAKELLKEDKDRSTVELHPLMEAHPDAYVVVCTAGCPAGTSAEIVSMVPKRQAPADATPAPTAANGPGQISCEAGCGAKGPVAMAAAPTTVTVGEWMTTVAKVPSGADTPAPKSSGSGAWMNKIDQARTAAQQPSAVTPAPAKIDAVKPEMKAEAKTSKSVAVEAVKPAAAAETKPVPPKAIKPTDVAASGTKVVVAAEASPAAPAAKPVAPVADKPAAIAEAKPPVTVEAKTAPSAEAKPPVAVAPKASVAQPDKPATPAMSAPAAPVSNQMAALDTAKTTPPPVKPAAPAVAPPAPVAPAAATKPADAKTAPSQDSEKPAAVAPVAPAPAKPATAEAQPAAESASPTKETTKFAAVTPPTVEKPVVAPPKQKDGVISVLSEDKDMNAAIQKARGSLNDFWKSYDAPASTEADHALKVAIAGNGSTEHFWLTRIKRENGKFSGVISNQPQSVTTVKMGQRYEFSGDMISDWTFKRNGKLVGNETMRILLPRMPEEQAAVYRQMYETP
jgi:uncharacterized protein YegJ (DUF2314 family)